MTAIRIDVDNRELEQFELDLAGAPERIQRAVPRAFKRLIGPKLAREMEDDADGHRYLGPLPKHVSFEMLGPFSIEAGIEYVGQGKLGHIIAHGSVNNAPVYDHTAGLYRTVPFALEVLADAGEEAVLGND